MKGYTNKLNILISKTSILTFVGVLIIFLFLQNLVFAFLYYYSQGLTYKTLLECIKFSFSVQVLDINFTDAKGWAYLVLYIHSILGITLWGVCISFLTMKFLFPSRRTIVFSSVAFYLVQDNQFCVMLVNTSKTYLENLHFMVVEKYYRRHRNSRIIYVPYLKNSVLTLKLGVTDILTCDAKDFDPMEDGIKVSLSCSLPFNSFSISVKYDFSKILIIENTDFRDILLLQEPDLKSDEFWEKFNFPFSSEQLTLREYIIRKRTS